MSAFVGKAGNTSASMSVIDPMRTLA